MSNTPRTTPTGAVWMVRYVVALLVLLAIALFVVPRFFQPSPPSSSPARFAAGRRIDGIPCTQEILSYHVHAHLSLFSRNHAHAVPALVGINNNRDCLYWLHTHDDSGVIHVEAPHPIRPSLGEFFDIWGQPLSKNLVDGIRLGPGEQEEIWVNARLFHGDPRAIVLRNHTDITIEVGPPFHHPKPYNFSGL